MIIAREGKIEAARGELGYTKGDLAEKSGISRQRVSAIEFRGEPTGAQNAKKICDALGKSFDELFQVVQKEKK